MSSQELNQPLTGKDAVHGLSCPRCGGIVAVPEGQVIVICPYCDQRSVVSAAVPVSKPASPPAAAAPAAAAPGDAGAGVSAPPNPLDPFLAVMKGMDAGVGAAVSAASAASGLQPGDGLPDNLEIGVRRYQAELHVDREQAVTAFKHFLGSKFQIARDAAAKAEISEVFLVHLPFWGVWSRGAAYAFGQEKVGSGDNSHYEAREKKVVREVTWNCPACEVGEFGVRQIKLDGCPLQPFDAAALHRSGMVFEPVGAEQAALEAARGSFEEDIKREVKLDRTAQVITRLLRPRLGLVYYPLWVVRYLYRGRIFQVVVDGVDGKILYGKGPGSVGYRAAVLVGGMALGALVAIDVPTLIMSSSSSNSDDNPFLIALLIFVGGLVMMYSAYHTFRTGEHYEYHRFGVPKKGGPQLLNLPGVPSNINNALRTLEKL